MKILLINPAYTEPISIFSLPISILHLGSWFRANNYEVDIFDGLHVSNEKELFSKLLPAKLEGVNCVGLSVMSTQIPAAIKISKYIKEKFPGVFVVWGGVHPTLYAEQTAEAAYIDCVISGHGEIAFADVLERIARNAPNMPKIVYGGSYDDVQMDDFPIMSKELIESIDKEFSLKQITERSLYGYPVITGRGCPHACSFCINSVMKEKYVRRSATKILDDIEILTRQYGVERIWIIDEDFFGDRRRAREFVDGIRARGLKFTWNASVRTSYFNKNYLGNHEYLMELYKTGCRVIGTGAESGSQRVLDMVNKHAKVDDAIHMAEEISKTPVVANFSFMIGLPDEEIGDYKLTLELMHKLVSIDKRFYTFGPQIYRPYPGSKLYASCLEYGMYQPKSLEEWSESPYIHFEFSKHNKYSEALYPWVKYKDDLTRVTFYATLMGKQPGSRIFTAMLRAIGHFRCKRFWFDFPIEKWLYGMIRGSILEQILRRLKVV